MTDHEHFGRIARLLTPSRRAVRDALAMCGPMTPDQIAACWQTRTPDMRPLVIQSLPQMVSQTLWKLENLNLVHIHNKIVTITELGREHTETT